jgi:hypothetical protein
MLQVNLMLKEKSIKNKKKTFLRNTKTFWFNDIDLARKNEKIVGLHPPCPQEVP